MNFPTSFILFPTLNHFLLIRWCRSSFARLISRSIKISSLTRHRRIYIVIFSLGIIRASRSQLSISILSLFLRLLLPPFSSSTTPSNNRDRPSSSRLFPGRSFTFLGLSHSYIHHASSGSKQTSRRFSLFLLFFNTRRPSVHVGRCVP